MRLMRAMKGLSIRQGVILVSIVVFTIAILTIGSVVFVNWIASARRMAESFAVDANKDALEAIDSFLDEPLHINTVTGRIIEQGLVDFTDSAQRDRFLTGVLLTHITDITSYTVGLETGELYGARRNAAGDVEVLRNNRDTGWNNVYYSIANDGTALKVTLDAGPLDPRARDWYIAAKSAGRQVFSPIFKNFLLDDLTISAAYPIYTADRRLKGVLGTHLVLGNISRYLEEIVSQSGGSAAIVESETGMVVANSFGLDNFVKRTDGEIARLPIGELGNGVIEEAFRDASKATGSASLLKGNGTKYYASTSRYEKDGLNWTVIVTIPQSLFMGHVSGSIKIAMLLAVVILVMYMLLHGFLTQRLTRPLQNLITAADGFLGETYL